MLREMVPWNQNTTNGQVLHTPSILFPHQYCFPIKCEARSLTIRKTRSLTTREALSLTIRHWNQRTTSAPPTLQDKGQVTAKPINIVSRSDARHSASRYATASPRQQARLSLSRTKKVGHSCMQPVPCGPRTGAKSFLEWMRTTQTKRPGSTILNKS